MITATFGSKQFNVKKGSIHTPSGVSIGESIDIEETEVKGKKPNTSVKGIKLQTLSFDVMLDSRFVTIETELRFWKSTLLSKKSSIFTLGRLRIGYFYLSQYDIKDISINKNGRYTKAVISLTFTEDGTKANSNTINFAESSSSVNSVVTSKDSKSSTKMRVGSTVKPKSGTRWYTTAVNAINKTGVSGLATVANYKITYTYNNNSAIHLGQSGWMRPEDVTVVSY